MKKIVFFLPVHGRNVPIGGFKVVYEYANRFANDYDVTIIYAVSHHSVSKFQLFYSIKGLLIVLLNVIRGYSGRRWFPLDKRIKENCLPGYFKCMIPKADSYVATAYSTAVELNRLNFRNVKLIYFIQGYENWDISDDELQVTYRYGMHNIVISNDLLKKVVEAGADSTVIPNGFDFNKFKLTIPIAKKNKLHISMLYHKVDRKGCVYGIEALKIVKNRYPDLQITFFGTPERPTDIPFEFNYYQLPDEATHCCINNEAAIYISPSLYEGWGLTVGEAMACGQAVVCTDNGGHREIAIDGENALLCPIKDSVAMANKILQLIEDDNLRLNLAANGYKMVQSFTWDSSYNKFKSIISK